LRVLRGGPCFLAARPALAEGLAILPLEQNLHAATAVANGHHVMSKGEICFTESSAELKKNDFVMKNFLAV
jgi:branched-chain amino acid transport system ATP-binding protein